MTMAQFTLFCYKFLTWSEPFRKLRSLRSF